MTTDIFKIFKSSIEPISVRKTTRGELTEQIVWQHTLDAIIKRRDGMEEAINESEDRETQTTVHFRTTDREYIEEGNFVLIDGNWRVIERWVDGKDFLKGKTVFIKAYLGNQITGNPSDPQWGT